MQTSLWGEEFEVKKPEPKTIIQKIKNPKNVKTVTKKTSSQYNDISINERIKSIKENVEQILGRYAQNTICIRNYEEFVDYINTAISVNELAVDTETNNSLDPISCKIMGLCLYSPNQKSAYIPVNHVNKDTNILLDGQITEEQIKEQLQKVVDSKCKVIMHNGKFDYSVIKQTCGIELPCYWDTQIAARILNENEFSSALKEQYRLKVDSTADKYDIEHLFEGLPYEIFDPELFALYAATDSYKTYYLYKWQEEQFNLSDNKRLKDVFLNIEMPVVQITAEMQLAGICIDNEYAERLSKKYHAKLEAAEKVIDDTLKEYETAIMEWRKTPEANYKPKSKKPNKNGEYTLQKSKSEQLANPPQVSSPQQLAILLYDVLKIPVVDQNAPRGTGEDILKQIKNPLCSAILTKRGLDKLIGTYIDKIPKCVHEKDHRLHASFNQLGTDTGRFSSNEPNLQNIPSHDRSIRLMFIPAEGNALVGSDFSQQEPRTLAKFSNCYEMLDAYKAGKDLYAVLASGIYKNKYEDNLEHYPDGSLNVEGDKRRSNTKRVLLGLLYGRGTGSIAEQLGLEYNETQKIIDDFFASFPKIKQWTTESEDNAMKTGYVEDYFGRRRRLPDIMLPEYTLQEMDNKVSTSINPLLRCKGLYSQNDNPKLKFYSNELKAVRNKKDFDEIKQRALKDGITIRNNKSFIAKAKRQCVNARIQGSAASLTKLAMIDVFNNQRLKELGFRMLLQVHDELIGECPIENAEEVGELLANTMKVSAEKALHMPFKCDAVITSCWYEDKYCKEVLKFYQKKLKDTNSEEEAMKLTSQEFVELTEEQINRFLQM